MGGETYALRGARDPPNGFRGESDCNSKLENANTKGYNGIITQPYTADNPTVGWDKTYQDKIKGLPGPNLVTANNPLPAPKGALRTRAGTGIRIRVIPGNQRLPEAPVKGLAGPPKMGEGVPQ